MKIVIWKDGTHLLVEDGITYEYENDKNWLTTISITEVKKAATALNENIHPLFKEILDAHCSPKADFFLPAVSDGEEGRFFIDERGGCIAVRDRQHPRYDPEYPGLHFDTADVIYYGHGVRINDGDWSIDERTIRKAREVLAHLNALQFTTPTKKDE